MKHTTLTQKTMTVATLALLVSLSPLPAFSHTANAANTTGIEKAKKVALKDANLQASNVIFTKAVQKVDDGVQIYEIEFYSGNVEYDYDIAVRDYRILDKDYDIEGFTIPNLPTPPTQNGAVSLEAAKSIALKDAGLNAQSVVFTKAKQTRDDGMLIYEIEFYSGNVEYDYEIAVNTGKIVDKDVDYNEAYDDDWDDDNWDNDWDDDDDWDDDWDD